MAISRFDFTADMVAKFQVGKIYGIKGHAYAVKINSRTKGTVNCTFIDYTKNERITYPRKQIELFKVWDVESKTWITSGIEFIDFPKYDTGFDALELDGIKEE